MGSEIINPANGRDRTNARLHYIMDTDFSWQLSAVVMRGKEEAALPGQAGRRPAVRLPPLLRDRFLGPADHGQGAPRHGR